MIIHNKSYIDIKNLENLIKVIIVIPSYYLYEICYFIRIGH